MPHLRISTKDSVCSAGWSNTDVTEHLLACSWYTEYTDFPVHPVVGGCKPELEKQESDLMQNNPDCGGLFIPHVSHFEQVNSRRTGFWEL